MKTIGEQVAEGIRWHTGAARAEAEQRARAILDRVGLPEAKFPLTRYPHELSGGQRQRVVIAIATALKPKLLIADEPTTALDVVLQAQILELLRELVDENRMGLLLISHDLAVVTEMSDRITILRRGEVMEEGETARVLSEQVHPYTRQLAQASMHVPAVRSLPLEGRVAAKRPGGVEAAALVRIRLTLRGLGRYPPLKGRASTSRPSSASPPSRATIPAGARRYSRQRRRFVPSMTSPSRCKPGVPSRLSAAPAAENPPSPA